MVLPNHMPVRLLRLDEKWLVLELLRALTLDVINDFK